MPETEDLRASADRVGELLDLLASLGDERAASWGEELVRCLTSLYGTAFERTLAAAASVGAPAGTELMERLAADDLVASVLLVHDLHPVGVRQRVERAVGEFSRSMPAADVRLLSLDESAGAAKLRIVVADRPGQSAAHAAEIAERRLRESIDKAAPEIESVEIDRLLPGTPVSFTRRRSAAARPPAGESDRAAAPVAELPDAPDAGEVCEMCSVPLSSQHRHVLNLETHSLLCCCQACTLLFERDGAAGGRFRAVPRDVHTLQVLELTQVEWDLLQIPVGVAFVVRDSETGQASAFYPGPAGATESLLSLGTYDELVMQHPVLGVIEPDVEALLVRIGRDKTECFVAPLDLCYELAGVLRQTWRGFDGGREAHDRIDDFFETLRQHARPRRVGALDG